MFLPRSPAPADRDSSSARLVSVHPNTWAAPTTAPASVQVHYHYLAGRYRDLSSENGLGLARLAVVPEAPVTTGSASGSDRGSVKSTPSKVNLTGIFLGASSKRDDANVELLTVPVKLAGQTRGNSKRDYAKERLRQDEVLQRRIQGTRDVGRLKWEAKSALLSASHPLVISLLTRAASLGSLSSALTLARLHASGATRGTAPVVVLVQRDPLKALAWALEASALLRRRTESRSKRGEATRSDDVDTCRQLASLLARLVRTRQADATRVRGNDVALPETTKPVAMMQLWSSLAPLLSWLSATNTSATTSAASTPAELDEVADDVDGNEKAIQESKAKACMAVDLAILRALALTRATLAPGEGGWAEAVRREWDEAEEAVTAARNVGLQGLDALRHVLGASHALCDALSSGKKKVIDNAAMTLAAACEASLPESSVPAVPDSNNSSKAAISAAAAAPSIITSSPRKGGSVQGQTSPRRTALGGRRRSLEDLDPDNIRAAHARAPTLLAPRGIVAPRAERSAAEALIVARSGGGGDDSPRRRLGRTMSLETGLVAATSVPGNGPSKKASESLLPLLRDARPGLKARRPSSVCSDSPSLLFPPRDDEYELGSRPSSPSLEPEPALAAGMSQASSSSSLWAATAAAKPVGPPRAGASAARRRVASLYGTPSMAPPATINTTGASVADYGDVGNGVFDPTASLRFAQSRRRRVDSDASISTALSVLSTAPSIAESMAWERDAPVFGLDRANERGQLGAADSLRKLRTQSSTGSLAPRDGPAAPMLTDRLERTIAASSSYRAASGGSMRGMPPQAPRQRKSSNASISSLSSFVSTASRQGANGNFRTPSMLGIARSMSQANTTAAAAASSTGASKSGGGVISALGSLKRLGGSSSSAARKNKSAGLEAIFTQPTEGRRSLDVSRPPRQSSEGGRASLDMGGLRLPPSHSASGSVSAAVSPSTSRRSFAHLDPTSSETYAGGRSGPSSPGVERDSLIPLSPTPMSPTSGTPNRDGTRSPSVASELDYALAAAEDRSRLKTAAGCDECGAVVINGAISRTGEKFCGRTCRMAAKAKKRAAAAAAATAEQEETNVAHKGKGKQAT